MAIALKEMAAWRKSAQGEKDQFKPILDDVYEYVIPYRKGISKTGKGAPTGCLTIPPLFQPFAAPTAWRRIFRPRASKLLT
jgi:hypothetical protein